MASNSVHLRSELERWLQRAYPRDVMMPCVGKVPQYPFKDGQWTWDDYESDDDMDVGILVTDLCVVDVDDQDTKRNLEMRFPILKTVPREITRRGMHYFFQRSVLCKDYHNQHTQGVDLKTVTRTGTPSFLVVAPSTNKTWVLTPWEYGDILPDIPDDLLNALFLPTRKTCAGTLVFADGVINVHTSGFQLLEEVLGDEVHTMPIGKGSTECMATLLEIIDTRSVSKWPVDLDGVRQLADYLCASDAIMRLLDLDNPRSPVAWVADVASRWPAWASARMCRDIEGLPTGMVSEPLSKDGRFLFTRKPVSHRRLIVRSTPRSFPECVEKILDRFGDHLAVAGGAALGSVVDGLLTGPSDIDLFPIKMAHDTFTALVEYAHANFLRVSRTGFALTMMDDDDTKVQVIMTNHKSVSDILNSFDMDPCKVAVYRGIVYAAASWKYSIMYATVIVDFDKWSQATVYRLFKYYARGFEIFVPGLERSLIIDSTWKKRQTVPGLLNVFAIERRIEATSRLVKRPTNDMLMETARAIMFGCESAYEEWTVGRTGYIIVQLCKRVLRWFGLAPIVSSTEPPLELVDYTPNRFPRQSPNFAAAYKTILKRKFVEE